MIDINSLNYSSDGKYILKNLTLKIDKGDCIALLGPNGAGKSSLIDVMTGIISQPVTGYVHFDNKPFNKIKKHVGVLFEYTPFFYYVTVIEWLKYLCAIHDLQYSSLTSLIEFLDISKLLNKQLQKISKGERRKVAILSTIMHDPSILILDEPTPDLDPFAREKVWELFKKPERTIFFTTHLWDEADTFANKVAFISKGKILASGDCKEFLTPKYLPGGQKIVFNKKNINIKLLDEIPYIIDNDHVNIYTNDLSYLTKYLNDNSVEHTISKTGLKDVFLILNQDL